MVEGGCDKQKSDTQTWLCRADDDPAGLVLVGVRNPLDPIQDVNFFGRQACNGPDQSGRVIICRLEAGCR